MKKLKLNYKISIIVLSSIVIATQQYQNVFAASLIPTSTVQTTRGTDEDQINSENTGDTTTPTDSSNSGSQTSDTSKQTDTSVNGQNHGSTNYVNSNNENVKYDTSNYDNSRTSSGDKDTSRFPTKTFTQTAPSSGTSSNNSGDSDKEVVNENSYVKQLKDVGEKTVHSKPTSSKTSTLKTPSEESNKDSEKTSYKSDFKPIDSNKYFNLPIFPILAYGVLIALVASGFVYLYKTRNVGTLKGMFTNIKSQLAKDVHHNPYDDHESNENELDDADDKNMSLEENEVIVDNNKYVNNQNEDSVELQKEKQQKFVDEIFGFDNISTDNKPMYNELSEDDLFGVTTGTDVQIDDKSAIDKFDEAFSNFSFESDNLDEDNINLSRLDKKKGLFSNIKIGK